MSDFMPSRVIIGLAKLAQSTEGGPLTCDDMRREIHKGAYDSILIRQCLFSAQRAGMSGEDTYVQLAYHALRQLEDTNQRLQQCLNLMPTVPLVK